MLRFMGHKESDTTERLNRTELNLKLSTKFLGNQKLQRT